MASAKTCADECQKAFLPAASLNVCNTKEPSVVKGVLVSMVVPLKVAEITFLAKPSLMLFATSIGVLFTANSLRLPSGKVILII